MGTREFSNISTRGSISGGRLCIAARCAIDPGNARNRVYVPRSRVCVSSSHNGPLCAADELPVQSNGGFFLPSV